VDWEVFTASDGVQSIRRADSNPEADRIYEHLKAEQQKTMELHREVSRLRRELRALRGTELSDNAG
jgi:hypothetical protein